MYATRSDGSKRCRVRQNRGLRCALVVFVLGLGGGQAYAQCSDDEMLVQVQKLTASDFAELARFGGAVSVSRNTTVVGAPEADCAAGAMCGSAYVFRSSGTSRPPWVEKQKLTASDEAPIARFGTSVSVSGDTAVVGAILADCAVGSGNCGSAYVFRFNGTSWVEEQRLTASDAEEFDHFGASVSVSGDTVVVGSFADDCGANIFNDCGSAYVFRFNGTSWIEEQKLKASDASFGAFFGISVSVTENTAVVGALESFGSSGSAYVFRFNGTSWVQEQKLNASDGSSGNAFGVSVSVSGETVVVGAPFDECTTGDFRDGCGSAYVFRFDGTTWIEEQKLTPFNRQQAAWFGGSVSLSGDTAVVGARGGHCPGPSKCGSAYVFRYNGTSWVQRQRLTASDADSRAEFGKSVSVSKDTVVVGEWLDDCVLDDESNPVRDCGSAYVFRCQPKCGNDSLQPGEQCDGRVGCTDCLCDTGFEPTNPPSVECQPTCGNGTLDPGEECDGRVECTDCLCDFGFEPTVPPSVDCQPICGNGNLDPGEACDGVNDAACPGVCRGNCTCGPFCGDGTCDPGEHSCSCTTDCGTPASHELAGTTCTDGLDNDCDGFIDADDPDCPTPQIPTVSQWGMIFLTLLLLAVGKIVFNKRARACSAPG